MVLCCASVRYWLLGKVREGSSPPCKCTKEVTPIAVVLGREDSLSALPPPPSPGGKSFTSVGAKKTRLTKSSSMVDQTAIWNSSVLSGLPPRRRAVSLTAIDSLKSNLMKRGSESTASQASVAEEKEGVEEEGGTPQEDQDEVEDEVDSLPARKRSYLSSDIDDMKKRNTSVIGVSSTGYEIRLK